MKTLVIDIGGTGTKCIVADDGGAALTERVRLLTPSPATPDAVLAVVGELLTQVPDDYQRVSVGFPGVVRRGVTLTAPNLGTEAWREHDLAGSLAALTGRPVRVLNDADMQGLGVISGQGVELALTLGTGLGAGLYVDGRLVPNLELGHHPFRADRTYEDLVGEAARKSSGKSAWRAAVADALGQIDALFNPDRIYVGGGNAKKLKRESLPANVTVFSNVEGMRGGVRMWAD